MKLEGILSVSDEVVSNLQQDILDSYNSAMKDEDNNPITRDQLLNIENIFEIHIDELKLALAGDKITLYVVKRCEEIQQSINKINIMKLILNNPNLRGSTP